MATSSIPDPESLEVLPLSPTTTAPAPANYSRYVQRIERRYEKERPLLAPGLPDLARMQATLTTLRAEHELGAALRMLRQLVLHRLIEKDVGAQASMLDITAAMTTLAELTLDVAYQAAQATLHAKYGEPLDRQGNPVQFWIVGMGKLGARELNVSSDIDLIYVYESNGDTRGNAQGQGIISNHEYFGLLVRGIQTLIGDTTEHGFVFRMDLALRPHGNSGPPAISLAALSEYFMSQGREWERFAWMKSRIVAPTCAIQTDNVQKLREVVLPFVFRRYLDYAVFDALRTLHKQIRDHANARCAGHPERANDVKISRGGIREIEFIVQLLQVVRGGQFPELRCRPTLNALERLAKAGLMDKETAQKLHHAYVFLRNIEHRIQYLDDQQTHILPVRDDDLFWIAQSMGFAETAHMLRQLDEHRELVAAEFDHLLGESPTARCQSGRCQKNGAPQIHTLDQLLAHLPSGFAQYLHSWQNNSRILNLREDVRSRLLHILIITGKRISQGEISEDGAKRFADWLENMVGRDSYFALLLERPIVQKRLEDLLDSARWPLRYLLQHPAVIDELATGSIFKERFDRLVFKEKLSQRRDALARTSEDDEESLMDLLRRAHHGALFRTLARDVNGNLSVEQVADDLSALADTVLEVATQWCWDLLRKKHRKDPQFAIIGYGKLGGLELGYGSDLDIVFVFEDDDDDAAEVYGTLVRKLISWLTTKTAEGDLYEIDTALRPNGGSGMLVTSFKAYSNYQLQRGSNTAWTWEHQAMTRARFVLGSDSLRHAFDEVRTAVIQSPRDHQALQTEIAAMRERMRQAHPDKKGMFDVKHSRGGMIDIEFATQYLVLAHSAQHPQLVRNAGNIALLRLAETAGLLPQGVGEQAANAYRELRKIQHKARLHEQPMQVPQDAQLPWQHAGQVLWTTVFGH